MTPREISPWTGFLPLISKIGSLLKNLVVVDAEYRTADRKVTRAVMTQRRVPLKPVQVDTGDAKGSAVEFRLLPSHGKCHRRIQDHPEIESVIGVFPEKIPFQLQETAESLLHSDIELVPAARVESCLAPA